MAAPNWSELPCELLNLISQHFDIEIDLIRFRSVCSNWRSSSIPNHHTNILPFKFPLPNYPFNFDSIINNNINSFCYLSKRITFLIKPPPQQQQQDQTLIRPWLIRITQNSSGKIKLFQPLLSYNSPPISFHYLFNFYKLSVVHLGTDFIIDDADNKLHLYCNYMYPEKVVSVTRHGKKPMILGTSTSSPKPVLFKCGDENWTVIPDMFTCFGDISVFKGRHYVVNKFGRPIRIGPDDLTVELVAEPFVGGDIKFLVENEGELLLVDIYESFCFSIEIFRLDVKEKKWVNLSTSLGDRVLFLGNGCSFSASASDLSVAKGNCVIFMDDDCSLVNKICNNASGMYVFDLDQGHVSPLSDYPDYLNLFWPPPEWIVKSYMRKPKKSMLSCIERFLM
jgi:hypothetical protein